MEKIVLNKFISHDVNEGVIKLAVELLQEALTEEDEHTLIFGNQLIYASRKKCGDIDIFVSTITRYGHKQTETSDESDGSSSKRVGS